MGDNADDSELLSFADLDSFTKEIKGGFDATWRAIWAWSLTAFALVHFIAGIVAYMNFRSDIGSKRFNWLIIVAYTVLGTMIPLTAGVITATMVAGVYSAWDRPMTVWEGFAWGVGQCILYLIASLWRNLSSL